MAVVFLRCGYREIARLQSRTETAFSLAATDYRYYSASQVCETTRIRQLRGVGFSGSAIAAPLPLRDDPAVLGRVLAVQRDQLIADAEEVCRAGVGTCPSCGWACGASGVAVWRVFFRDGRRHPTQGPGYSGSGTRISEMSRPQPYQLTAESPLP